MNFHQLPFWNNLFFSGTPLLPDPQAPIFYIPNLIFLIFKNLDTGFVISLFIHIFIGGIGMYFLAKKGFAFSQKASLFCAFLYMVSPKLSSYIEAGHFGLITSWGWLPYVFLFTILVSQKPSFRNISLLAFFWALVFYCHILIFGITVIAVTLFYFYLRKNPVPIIATGLLCFGFIAISFLPQLSWQSQSTRSLLLNDPDVYPKWLGIKEFLKASISPIIFGYKFIWDLDTEKTIAIGLLPTIFAFIGFWDIRRKNKIVIFAVLFLIILISLNNVSPLYKLLIKQNWYILLRVSTRFWFLNVFILILLAGRGLDILLKRKNAKFLVYILAALALVEIILTSWTKIYKPIQVGSDLAPKEIYEFLANDKSLFRVFCLERCFSQKETAIYGLQLAEGYGTLQQMNYYLYSQQLSQSFYRNRYTLSIPPFEIYEYENLQPYAPNLAAYNIKYVVSDHVLNDKNLKFVKQFGKYLIYLNGINLPRSNYPISSYTPNFIRINVEGFKGNTLTLSEVYNKDWKAYLNGKDLAKITETADKTRSVKIADDTKFVDFVYLPKSFEIGLIIILFTFLDLIPLFITVSKMLNRTARKRDS